MEYDLKKDHVNYRMIIVVVGSCKNETSSWPIEILCPRRWNSILYDKNNRGGRKLQPTYIKNTRKIAIGELDWC